MNKIILICSVFLCIALTLQAQQKFTIAGKLTELKEPQKITLTYGTGKKVITDTTTVINGAFSFSGKVQYPVKASLSLLPLRPEKNVDGTDPEPDRQGTQDFFVEQGTISVSGRKNMKGALIKGGKTQGEYLQLRKQVEPLQDLHHARELKLSELINENMEAAKKKFGQELTPEQQSEARSAAYRVTPAANFPGEIIKVEHDFIRQHPDSYVSFDFVRDYSGNAEMNVETFESLYNSLSQRLRDRQDARLWPFKFYRSQLESKAVDLDKLKSIYAKLSSQYKHTSLARVAAETANLYLQRINLAEATAIGRTAIPVRKVDINGNPVNWEGYKGKYLLLNFWATYCGSCRKAHPGLKALYAKYKDKGFEILGIADEEGRGSLEHKEKLWKAAIIYDGLPWPQVLNNIDKDKFDACKAYNVVYDHILLDKEGKIMGRYSVAELEQKLKEAFGF
jgi:thiol-disulfide isomerase/thioredoxin